MLDAARDVTSTITLLVAMVFWVSVGCASNNQSRREPPKPQMMEGGRKAESASKRASEQRPQPWLSGRRALDHDRMGIEAYRAHRRAEQEAKQRAARAKKKPAKKN
jgi:hypothetical protein